MSDEERIDGRKLKALREPGSDDLLSEAAKVRIAEVVAEMVIGTRDRDR
jgi:hypothetical protein